VGLLASYTTFSTWSLVSCRLIEDGAHLLAAANLVGNRISA
jgi:fluoride ion exporter CrcB/FEX